jgi:hypothetical protein
VIARTDDRRFSGGALLFHEECMIATLMSHCKIQFEAPTKIGEYSLYTEFGSRASSFNQSFSADLITGLDTNGNSFGIGEFIGPSGIIVASNSYQWFSGSSAEFVGKRF